MPAQVELLVLLLIIAGGVAFVVVRVRRGALDEERAALAEAEREAVDPADDEPRSDEDPPGEGEPPARG